MEKRDPDSLMAWDLTGAIVSSVVLGAFAVVFIMMTSQVELGIGIVLGVVVSAIQRVIASYLRRQQFRKQAVRNVLAP